MGKVSDFDVDALVKIRANVEAFLDKCAASHDHKGRLLLDIAPQNHRGAAPHFAGARVETLDIDPESGATHIVDLCRCADVLGGDRYDFVVCTEVLEHTRQPFDAVSNIFKILKKGGVCFVTTPFNFRIHGSLPDCWRFTEHGLRELFSQFDEVEIEALDVEQRFLMPYQYTLIARKSF